MLASLSIENIAVIEKADIQFESGLNVLTGETGAGKSIIIDSINAILGERTSRDLVRAGTQKATVSAFFEDVSNAVMRKAAHLGIPVEEDNSMLIQRSVQNDGRNACRVNGKPVTVSMLKELGHYLINIHGQHDSQALLSAEKHYVYLDLLAENSAILKEYKDAFREWKQVEKELSSLQVDEDEKLRKMDLLRFQIQELEDADITPGERESLTEKRLFFQNAEKIANSLQQAYIAVQGSDEIFGALQQLHTASAALQDSAQYRSDLSKLSENVSELCYTLEEYADELRSNLGETEINPEEREEVDDRLDLLYRLSRKYGETEEEMLAFLDNCRTELDKIEFADEYAVKLQQRLKETRAKAEKCAERLSESRRTAAENMAKQMQEELSFLDMPNVRFAVQQEETEMQLTGADKIEFMLSANPGEPLRPLAKIASGGELSRIMLAIKNVLSDKDITETLIFDEVDTGVSGRAAQKIALKLKQVSSGRQVICVTHLAQIAAQAENHLFIEKKVHDERTFTEVHKLSFEERKHELARIIGGIEVTPIQLQSAQEMLENAGITG